MQQTTRQRTLLSDFISQHGLNSSFAKTAQDWFIRLADTFVAPQLGANSPLFIGVNGSQGSGKSTLCDFVKLYIESQYEVRVVVMSLDDFYYSHQHRRMLARDIHPLLQTRGVPGTHDTNLMTQVLQQLKHKQAEIVIPRFNKATDNPYPEQCWQVIRQPVDIVLFEGWCWGVEPQTVEQLTLPANQLERLEDANSVWRKYVNQKLANDYQPLYSLMDRWIMLAAPSFAQILSWRTQQEHALKARLLADVNAAADMSGVMNDQQLVRFIEHYQRLTEHALQSLPKRCDVVLYLDQQRIIYQSKGLG